MPTDINNDNLYLKSLNTKQSKPYADGNPCPNMREARKVMDRTNIANVVHTLFS
jgi:hypothetical protein